MILHPTPVSASDMAWIPELRMFSCDESDIGGLGRVYDDACDVGLTLHSRYAGRDAIVFVVYREGRDEEGELLWVDLEPARQALRGRVPFRVRVHND